MRILTDCNLPEWVTLNNVFANLSLLGTGERYRKKMKGVRERI